MKSIQRTAVLTLVMVLLCATALATPRGPVCWWCGSRDTEWADYTHFFESTHSHHYYCHNPNCILNKTWGGAKGDEPEPCSFTIPADCTKGASCVCGNTSGSPVHAEVIDTAVAPTCTETGLTEGRHCSLCDTVLLAQETVPATGHTIVTDSAIPMTCTEDGKTEGSHCSVCGAVLVAQETLPATGHTASVDAAVAPTCIGTGLTEGSHCATCAEVLVARQALPAIAHQYLVTVTPPTCAADGYSANTCAQCSSTYTADVIARKGHVNGAWINTGNDTHSSACKRASCGHVRTGSCEYTEVTMNGQQMNICAVCGAMRINAAKNSKAIETALPPIPGAAAEPVGGGLLPRGRLIVYSQENPFDGVLHALSVAFEYAGQISELSGPVRVYVPFESASAFKLYHIAGEVMTDIPFTYEDGVISFQIDQAGLFLLAADGASFSLPSA